MQKPVLVIKLGTAVITGSNGVISRAVIRKVAREIAVLSKNFRVTLVSSGAVATGKTLLRNYKGSLTERKAAAAVGNPILIQLYQKQFANFKIPVAQALCERHHFSNRSQFLQLKDTFEAFWENNILPIVNENDLVSNVELKFSDNDELATLLAVGFNAEAMIISTSVGGFKDKKNEIIPVVHKIDHSIMDMVNKDKTSLGLGGMLSKLTFTRLANSLGIRVIICGLSGPNPFSTALLGKNGTIFNAGNSNLKARQKWLASGSITFGSITIDKGAAKALEQRRSLLTVGITRLHGRFETGEVVQLMDDTETIIGVAKVKMGNEEIIKNLTARNIVTAHADDIVIF